MEDVLRNRSPAGAAERLRPVRCDPAFGVESPLPVRDVRAIRMEALTFALCQIGWQMLAQKCANLLAKCHILLTEAEIHERSSDGRERSRELPPLILANLD